MTEKELSVIRSCFDYRGSNHSQITDYGDKCEIIGPGYSDIKYALVAKNQSKYDLEWVWTDKSFKQSELSLAQVKKTLKFYNK